MKKIFLAVTGIYLLGCAETLPPLGPQSELMEQANAIIIRTGQSPEDAYKGFAMHLSDNGMMIKSSDEILMTVNTEPKDLPALYMGKYAVQASVREDSEGTFIKVKGFLFTQAFTTGASGQLKLTEEYSDADVVKNAGMVGSPFLKSWEEIVQMSLAYPNKTKILYSRE